MTKYRRDPTLGMDRVLFITKQGEEGILAIDEGTGGPLTPLDDVPEWAANLASAMLAERMKFYINRLGIEAATPLLKAKSIDVGDLDWVTVEDDGLEHSRIADAEVRSANLSEVLGISTSEAHGLVKATHDGAREIIDQFDLDKTEVLTPAQSKAQTAEMLKAGQGFKDETQKKQTGQQGGSRS